MDAPNHSKVMKPKPVFVTKGLDGQDAHIDVLENYFNEMKRVTVEPACGDLDLLTFAACTLWFGVIAIHGENDCDEVWEANEEGSSADSSSAFASNAEPFSHPLLHKDVTLLSIEEIDEYWEEAFMEQMEENEIKDEKFVTGNVREIIGRNTPDPEDLHILESPPMSALPPSSEYEFYIPQPPPETPEPLPSDEEYAELFDLGEGPQESQEIEMTGHIAQQHQIPQHYPNIRPIGREYLQRVPRRRPTYDLVLEEDPLVLEERQRNANRIRDELRLERVIQYQKKLRIRAGLEEAEPQPAPKSKPKSKALIAPPAPSPRSPSPEPYAWEAPRERYNPIGLIYLSTSQNYDDPLHLGECTLGFYVDPAHRHRPNLSMALDAATAVAFRDHSCHRVQSIIVDNPEKLYSLQTLATAGFSQEGMRRRAFFSPVGQEYKDVHYLAMLAMEWSFDLNSTTRIRPQSLWDEVLSRHRWEQEEILRLEDRSLKRTHSMETIREPTSLGAAAEDLLEAETTNSPSKRRRLLRDADPYCRGRSRSSVSSSAESSISQSTNGGGYVSDTGFDSDWSIVSSLARFSLPSSPGSSHFADTDGYMSDMSIVDRSERG